MRGNLAVPFEPMEAAMNIDERKLSRRAFAKLAAGASVGALLASGCRDVGRGATTLRFWNGFTGPDGPVMLGIVRAFNAMNDDVQVVMQRIDWNTYFNKLFVAGLGGRAPEVFIVPMYTFERFYGAGFLSSMDALFDDGRIDANDIDANVLAPTRRAGRRYAVPIDVHPAGVYYNKRLFAEANIAKPPETRAEFLDALHKLKRSADGGLAQWGFVYEWLMVNLYTLVRQFDGGILADDAPDTVTLDSPQTREAFAFAASLIHEFKLVPPIENMNAFIGFRQGRVGMVWAGIFMLGEARKQTDLAFGAATIPVIGDRPAVWAGTHNLCIRAGVGDAERTAAERFVRFISDHTLDWAEAGQVPVRKTLRDTDRFKAMETQSIFARQIPIVNYMPSTPFTFEYQSEFEIVTEAILRNTRTPEAALATASTNIRRVIDRFAQARGALRAGGGAA